MVSQTQKLVVDIERENDAIWYVFFSVQFPGLKFVVQ